MKKIFRLLLLMSFFAGLCASATELAWQQTLDEESTWSKLTFAGTLLVASENQLTHFDPSTGEVMWQHNAMRKLAQFDVRDVSATPFLVVNTHIDSKPRKSRLHLLDLWTGESLWDTGDIDGYVLGAYPLPRKNLLVSVLLLRGDDDAESGTFLIGYSLRDGQEQWRTRIGSNKSLPLHTSAASAVKDLSGHPQPVEYGDTLILAAGDLIAISTASGEIKWRFELNASVSGIKQTYAQPLLADGILYAVGKSHMHAIDAASGAELWKTKIGSAALPQIEFSDGLIVGRMGGTFSTGKNVVRKSPFGAYAVSTDNGELAWKWKKARHSVTNIKVFPDQGLVMLADKQNLYALDLNAERRGKVVFEEKLQFKRKLGAADIAAKGLKTIGGLLRGQVSVGDGSNREDPPLDIEMYGDRLLVRAQYHVLAFNLNERKTDWSIEFVPPGVEPLTLVAMGAVAAYVVADRAGRAVGYDDTWAERALLDATLSVSSGLEAAVAARYAAAQKSRNLAFFLTTDESGIVLVGIDLLDGAVVGQIPMTEKTPQFMVDALGSRVYYFRGKNELLAYDF